MNARLDDDQLEALFLAHWSKTKDLRACLRLVRDAVMHGETKALARAGADHRHASRAEVAENAAERTAVVRRVVPIVRRFAQARGVPFRELVGRGRTRTVARFRWEAMWLLKTTEGMSFPEISLVFGGRSHSLAIHGFRLVEQRIAADPTLRSTLLATVKPERRRAA